MERPRSFLPTPTTPLANGSFAFENDKEIPKTPIARSPSFFSKNSEQKKKVHEREVINKLEEEQEQAEVLYRSRLPVLVMLCIPKALSSS